MLTKFKNILAPIFRINFYNVKTLLLKNYFLIKNDKIKLICILFWPTPEVFTWFVVGKWLDQSNGNIDYSLYFIISALFWSGCLRFQYDVTYAFNDEYTSSDKYNFFKIPVTFFEFFISIFIYSLIIFILYFGMSLAFILFTYNNNYLFTCNFFAMIPAVILSGFCTGILIITLLLRYGHNIEPIIFISAWILWLFTGVYNSLDLLPRFIQIISKVIPQSYFFEFLHEFILNKKNLWDTYAIGMFLAFSYLIIFLIIFRYQFIRIKKNTN